ncbi:MAG TPA: bifunctional nuclease domain-containing protein [Gaiellaceae bacterium]
MPAADTDSALVAATLAGDRAAFARLIDRHAARAASVAGSILGRTDAEDVVQEAMLAAYLGLDRLRRPERFGGWLYAITANLAKMRFRQRGSNVSFDELGGRWFAAGEVDLRLTPQQAVEAAELLERVRSAFEALPPRQRDVALLYYVDGLSCGEIAALLGSSAGAVRVGLHRARRELRRRLDRKESVMAEVTLEDVIVRAVPTDGEEPKLANDRLRVVLLREKDGGGRLLPIWVGAPEGDALALQLGGDSMPRPLTTDLMARLLEAAGANVERVTVNSLREETFYAVVRIVSGAGAREIDSRPSDALNLAARVGAPIFVDDEVMANAGIAGADLERELAETCEKYGWDLEAAGEWRSLSPELVKALHPPPGRR